jgi:hypothetical protein
MPRKLPPHNSLAAYRRNAIAARRIGTGRKCRCGESRPEALIPGSSPAICAKCDRKSRKRKPVDDHHVFGKTNSPLTMSIPVNDHRAELSVAQQAWPPKTLENKRRSQSLADAAKIRGFIDTVEYLMHEHLLPVAERRERFDTIEARKLRKNTRRIRS